MNMKNAFYLGGLAILAFLASGCSKEATINDSSIKEVYNYSLILGEGDWDGSRSSYTAGTGITLSGSEKMALYYKESDGRYYGDASDNKKGLKALPDGGHYSFTSGEDLSGKEFYAILPYSSILTLGNSSTGNARIVQRLSPVQFPGANTFDPMCDVVLGKPTVIDANGVINVPGYKRVFAPLKVNVSGLSEGEKIYSLSFSLSQAASGLNSLAGMYRLALSDKFDKAGIAYNDGDSFPVGNSLSAIYPEGLSAINGVWPVWFIVNPIDIEAGTTLSISVTTSDSTYTRNIALPTVGHILRDKINELPVNAKGAGYTARRTAFQHFTAGNYVQASAGALNQLQASDGLKYDWYLTSSPINWLSADRDNGSDVIPGLFLYTNRVVKLPAAPKGKFIKSLSLYAHPCSYATDDNKAVLTLNDGSADVSTHPFNYYPGSTGLYSSCGKIDIQCPAGVDDIGEYKILGANASNISAVGALLSFEDDPDYVEETTETITLAFNHYDEANSKYVVDWPFTGTYSVIGSSWNAKPVNTGRTELSYEYSSTTLTFAVSATTDACMNTSRGIRFGTGIGDYFEVPAITGKKLVSVTLYNGYTQKNGTPKICDTEGNTVRGGGAYEFPTNSAYTSHTWELEGTVSAPYRITATAEQDINISRLELVYANIE